jgi:hypothetical protein
MTANGLRQNQHAAPEWECISWIIERVLLVELFAATPVTTEPSYRAVSPGLA